MDMRVEMTVTQKYKFPLNVLKFAASVEIQEFHAIEAY
jgi:hypothetical protein